MHKMYFIKNCSFYLCLALFSSLLWSCKEVSDELEIGESFTLSVMSTTDIHGWLMPWDYNKDQVDEQFGLVKAATFIDSIRTANPYTLLMDAGDWLQGNSLAEFFARPEQKGKTYPFLELVDFLNYDAVVIGNHEFNFGLDLLSRRIEETKSPIIVANVTKVGSEDPAYQPYVLREIKGVKVAILGLTTPGSAFWDRAHVEGKLKFHDGLESAKKWVPYLKEEEKADVVIVLAHTGWTGESSYAGEEGFPPENFAASIAAEVEGVDLLVIGHSHRRFISEFKNKDGSKGGVIQAGRWGSHLAVANLEIGKDPSGIVYTKLKSQHALEVEQSKSFGPAVAKIEKAHEEVRAYVNEKLSTSPDQWSAEGAFFEENPVIELIHRVQKHITDADISIASVFNRNAEFGPGNITRKNMVAIYPFENRLFTMKMKGKTLKKYLEQIASCYHWTGDSLLLDDQVAGYNIDQLDGVNYEIHPILPEGQRIRNLSFNGKPITDDQEFLVAINSYRAEGGGGYEMVKEGEVIYRSEKSVRELLENYVQTKDPLLATEVMQANWKIVTP